MTDLKAPPGELRFTLSIKRAATGKTDTVEMVGHPLPEPVQDEATQPVKEQ